MEKDEALRFLNVSQESLLFRDAEFNCNRTTRPSISLEDNNITIRLLAADLCFKSEAHNRSPESEQAIIDFHYPEKATSRSAAAQKSFTTSPCIIPKLVFQEEIG